jgi:hypothetical protein
VVPAGRLITALAVADQRQRYPLSTHTRKEYLCQSNSCPTTRTPPR